MNRINALAIAMAVLTGAVAAKTKPNVIVILGDDMGIDSVSAFNPKMGLETPAIDRLAKLEPLADGGRRHLERPAAQHLAPERFWKFFNRLAGTRNDDEFGQLGQVVGITPLRQRKHMVGTDEIMKLGLGITLGVIAQSIDRVGDAITIQLLHIDFAIG